MRITVTLDDDASQMIREEMRRTQRSFEVTLNDAVRNGLRRVPEDTGGFQVRARPLRLRTGIDSARMHDRDQDAEEERLLRVTQRALQSDDTDFSRLRDVRWRNPLTGQHGPR